MLSVFAVLSGLVLDRIYTGLGLSASAIAGQAGEIIPYWLQLIAALIVIALSLKPLYLLCRTFFPAPETVVQKKSKEETAGEKTPADTTVTECRGPT